MIIIAGVIALFLVLIGYWSWRERLYYIKCILTGNVGHLWEMILSKEKALRIAEFIQKGG